MNIPNDPNANPRTCACSPTRNPEAANPIAHDQKDETTMTSNLQTRPVTSDTASTTNGRTLLTPSRLIHNECTDEFAEALTTARYGDDEWSVEQDMKVNRRRTIIVQHLPGGNCYVALNGSPPPAHFIVESNGEATNLREELDKPSHRTASRKLRTALSRVIAQADDVANSPGPPRGNTILPYGGVCPEYLATHLQKTYCPTWRGYPETFFSFVSLDGFYGVDHQCLLTIADAEGVPAARFFLAYEHGDPVAYYLQLAPRRPGLLKDRRLCTAIDRLFNDFHQWNSIQRGRELQAS